MSPEELRRLSPDELGEGAFLLRQLSFWLQCKFNREATTALIAGEQVKKRIAPKLKAVQGGSAEERRSYFLLHDAEASDMESVRVESLARSERVSFLVNRVEGLARSLESLAETKRTKRYE